MKRRLILLVLVAVALAPGTWLRSAPPPVMLNAGVEVIRLAIDKPRIGALDVIGTWQLKSEHSLFHGYSGLVALGGGKFLAASDAGAGLAFSMASGGPTDFELFPYDPDTRFTDKMYQDIEALAHDPGTGRVWAAFEGRNMIERREGDLSDPAQALPEPMRRWGENSGPEAMTRLSDGSFLMLGEGRAGFMGEEFPGLKWQRDPVLGDKPMEFSFAAPEGFRPTDMAALPDGRVLILVRRIAWGFPPHFKVVLLVADPAEIVVGESWSGTELARFDPPFPTDNYEGLAIEPGSDRGTGYPVMVTIISDDNAVSYQRTLLLRLQWDGKLPAPSR
ncbi:esterase-like activity of phytase family protein [Parerythrobacter aestuarii]|uniref:esterase-like activity of phytase family protein n=1 Tax=Parerythrobacter aestuarii TaxID=3020909 RepID=UPI0024DE4A52|nr:esterase-like activity of phytase family protein [Parerythrobacter aestuarii]